MDRLDQDNSALKEKLEAQETVLQEHKARLDTALESKASLEEVMSRVDAKASEQVEQIGAVRKTMGRLEQDNSALKEKLEAQETVLQEHKARLESVLESKASLEEVMS